jgi:hypothetical protein
MTTLHARSTKPERRIALTRTGPETYGCFREQDRYP